MVVMSFGGNFLITEDTKSFIDGFYERAQFVKNYVQLRLQNNSQTIERSQRRHMLTTQWAMAGLRILQAYVPEFKPQLISNGARKIYESEYQLIIIFCVLMSVVVDFVHVRINFI